MGSGSTLAVMARAAMNTIQPAQIQKKHAELLLGGLVSASATNSSLMSAKASLVGWVS